MYPRHWRHAPLKAGPQVPLDTWGRVSGMVIAASPSFSDSLATAALRQREQMWQAAQTVRAHVGAGEQRDDLLSCLGLSDAVPPDA